MVNGDGNEYHPEDSLTSRPRRDPPWKVVMHCRGKEGDWALDAAASGRIVLARDQVLTIRVLGDHAFSATLELPARSALLAIVEGLVLINRELPRLNMPGWPAVEICAEPVEA